jgi:hypothetical protein
LLAVAACSASSHASEAGDAADCTAQHTPRAQLSIGYSLLYQEADGIPKLRWLLMFKEKTPEMGQTTREQVAYYRQLADTMRDLSRERPDMRIDVQPISDIEADARKAIGADLAKDIAPVIGKSGIDFEREVLLTFYNGLNEQRHLVGVMIGMETDPALKRFLQTTQSQLDARHARIGALLSRAYFTH